MAPEIFDSFAGAVGMKEFFGDYLAIGVGLMIGSAAHLGKLMTEGKMPSWLQVIGYLLQLGLVGLVCAVTSKKVGIHDADMRALSAAILALSANETVQFIKKKAKQPLLQALARMLSEETEKEG